MVETGHKGPRPTTKPRKRGGAQKNHFWEQGWFSGASRSVLDNKCSLKEKILQSIMTIMTPCAILSPRFFTIYPNNKQTEKLMSMMRYADTQGPDFCVRWLDAKSIIVSDPETFTKEVVSKFFKPTKFSSFTRKLYRWGFRQLNRGIGAEDPVVFGNDFFQRDAPEKMVKMKSTTAAATRKQEELAKASSSYTTQLSGNKRPAEVDQIELQQQMLLGQLLQKKSHFDNQSMMVANQQGVGMVSPSDSFYNRSNNALNVSNHSSSSSHGVISQGNATMSLTGMMQQGRNFSRGSMGSESMNSTLHNPLPSQSLTNQSLNGSLHGYGGPTPTAMNSMNSMMNAATASSASDDSSLLGQFMPLHNQQLMQNNRINNMANMMGGSGPNGGNGVAANSHDLLGSSQHSAFHPNQHPQDPASFQDLALARQAGSMHPTTDFVPSLQGNGGGLPTAFQSSFPTGQQAPSGHSMMAGAQGESFPNAATTADIVNAAIQALKHA